MAVVYSGIRIINVYAPSGTVKRTVRERFCNMELPILFSKYTNPIQTGGDFNCILQPVDTTGTFTTSTALAEIVRELRLTDMWHQDPRHPIFTHYSPTGASRKDRIYLSIADKDRKTGIEILPTAYTDHHDVVIRLFIPAPETPRRRGRWKINPDIVHESTFKENFQNEWEMWQNYKRYYPDVRMWWERHVKKSIKRLVRQVEFEHIKNHKIMENHLYECLHDIMKANIPETNCQPCRNTKPNKYNCMSGKRRIFFWTQALETEWTGRTHPCIKY